MVIVAMYEYALTRRGLSIMLVLNFYIKTSSNDQEDSKLRLDRFDIYLKSLGSNIQFEFYMRSRGPRRPRYRDGGIIIHHTCVRYIRPFAPNR